eukprot:3752160-Prymnesium_polylepis.1
MQHDCAAKRHFCTDLRHLGLRRVARVVRPAFRFLQHTHRNPHGVVSCLRCSIGRADASFERSVVNHEEGPAPDRHPRSSAIMSYM